MGVDIKNIIQPQKISMVDLVGRKVAIDAFNTMYQFITTIRQPDGTPLKDSKGNITSHLSGLFYRTSKMLEEGIKPCFVFDGDPPEFKQRTVKERSERRKVAREKYELALKEGREDDARKYGQQSATINEKMIHESKKMLDALGVPWVQAPSEGEAQASQMAKNGLVWAAASQDYDSLLFGTPIFIRNMTVTGRKKLPRKMQYVDIVPELIDTKKCLEEIGITQNQLIIIGLLIGTDFNSGIHGIGAKKALALVKEHGDEAIKHVEWDEPYEWESLIEFFTNPPTVDVKNLNWATPNIEELVKMLCDGHDFSEDRVTGILEKVNRSGKAQQKKLDSWF